MRATRPGNLKLLYLILPIVYGVEYKLRTSALSNSLHPPVTFCLLRPNILVTALFLRVTVKVFTPRI